MNAGSSSSHALHGMMLMVFGTAMLASMDAMAKLLVGSLSAAETVWLRYAVNVVILIVVFRVMGVTDVWRAERKLLQVLRALCLLGATLFNFWALRTIQLSDLVAIMFMSPLVVTVLAGPILGEVVGLRRWGAVMVGFAGMLIVTRPGTEGFEPGMLLSAIAMICFSLYNLLNRMLRTTESAASLVMLSAVFITVVLSPAAPGAFMRLDGWDWLVAVLLGALGAAAHFSVTLAHRYGEASALAPFLYCQMIFAIILGALVFGHLPDGWTLVGAAVIAGSGLYVMRTERRLAAGRGPGMPDGAILRLPSRRVT